MEKLWDLKKFLSYLELERQRHGIIMEVTCPLLLEPFYLVKWPVNPNILSASVCKIGKKKDGWLFATHSFKNYQSSIFHFKSTLSALIPINIAHIQRIFPFLKLRPFGFLPTFGQTDAWQPPKRKHRGWCPKFATWLDIKIGIAQKVYELWNCYEHRILPQKQCHCQMILGWPQNQ